MATDCQLQAGSSLVSVVLLCAEFVLAAFSLGLAGFSEVLATVGPACCVSASSAAWAIPVARYSMVAIMQAKLDIFVILSPLGVYCNALRVALFARTGKHFVCQCLICLIANGFKFSCREKVTISSDKKSGCHDTCRGERAEPDRAARRNDGMDLREWGALLRRMGCPVP